MSYSRRPAVRTVVWTVALALQLGLLVVVGNKMAISGDGLRASTVAHRYTVRPAEAWLVDSERVGPTTSQRVDAPMFTRVAVETGQTRFEGYGVPSTMVDLVVDGNVVGAARVDHLGRWRHSWRVLAPGDHRIEARSTDTTGLRTLIGETIGVAIPPGFVGGTLLEAEPPSPQIRTQVAPNETRRRAEALAAAAEDAYAQVAEAQGWTRLAQADTNSATRTDGGGSVRSAPPALRRSSDAAPPEPDTGVLAPVTNWLDQASRSYHTIIVPRLSAVRETETVAPLQQRREPEQSPVRTVQRSSPSDVPPPPVRTLRDGSAAPPETSGTASVLDDVRGWLQRASRDYRTIVRGLANPDSSLIEAQRERRPAPTRVRPNDADERRREIAEARKADEERRAAEARAREREDRRSAAQAPAAPAGQAPAAPAAQAPEAVTQLQRQEDDRRAEEARQAEALRRQAEASRRADEARIAEMQRAEQERLARDARERAEAQKRAEELAAAQARQREAEAARRADEQRRLQAAREDAQERARREAAARAAEAQAARERAMETARQEAEAARERAAAEARRQAEAERQRAADAARRARESQQAEARAQARAQAEAQARAEAQAQAQAQARARDEAERRAREAAVRERAQALARTANETRETIRIPDTAARSAPTAQEDNVLEAARRQAVEILKRERLIMAERTGPDRAPAARAPSISAPQPPARTPLAEAREKAMALIRSERERIASMKSRQREQADALRRAAAAPKVRSRDEVIEQGSATRGPVGDSARRIAGRLSDRERSSLGAGGVATTRARQRAGAAASCRRAGRKVRTPGFYVVAPGDTLWDIAERHYDDGSAWRRIRTANRNIIDDVDLIRPCQRLRLPGS